MENAIELHNVTKVYPGAKALDGISFSVKKGSIHAFLGPNGAGKSTTMNIITGLIPPSSGEVKVLGKAPGEHHLVGFLPEIPPLYPAMKVGDYLKFVSKIHSLKDKRRASNSTFSAEKIRDEVIEKCGLNHVLGRLIGNLSKGYRQRVGMAQALIFDPEVVILDEPTVGLDPKAIIEIRDLIKGLKNDHTILLSTHQLHEAQLLCSDVTIINKGKILKSGDIDEIARGLSAMQTLNIKVEKWDHSFEKRMRSELRAENIRQVSSDEGVGLKIFFDDKEDKRAKVSRFIVENNLGLIELQKERLGLEDIFTKVTGPESERESFSAENSGGAS